MKKNKSMKEMYLTKEELILFLQTHEITQIRIIAENGISLRINKRGGKEKIKILPANSAMIEIITVENEEKQEGLKAKQVELEAKPASSPWCFDSTGTAKPVFPPNWTENLT